MESFSFQEPVQLYYSCPNPGEFFSQKEGVLVFIENQKHSSDTLVQISLSHSSESDQEEHGSSVGPIILNDTVRHKKMTVHFLPDFESSHRDLVSRIYSALSSVASLGLYPLERVSGKLFDQREPFKAFQLITSRISAFQAHQLFFRNLPRFLSTMKLSFRPTCGWIGKMKSLFSRAFVPAQNSKKVGNFRLFCVLIDEQRSGFYITHRHEKLTGGNKVVQILHPCAQTSKVQVKYAFAKAKKKSSQGRYTSEERQAQEGTLRDECEIVSYLHQEHVPNIIDLIKVDYETAAKAIRSAAYMEYCDKGTLSDYTKSENSLPARMKIAEELVAALFEMHKVNVFHLDLQSRNVLIKTLENGRLSIRIIDFGNAERIEGNTIVKTGISAIFPAPEMVIDCAGGGSTTVTQALDLWSLGDLLYLLKFRVSPCSKCDLTYRSETYLYQLSALRAMLQETLNPLDPLDQTIGQLLSEDPASRPPAGDVLRMLREWLAQNHPIGDAVWAVPPVADIYT